MNNKSTIYSDNNEKVLSTEAVIKKLSMVSVLGNVILSVFKMIAGIFGHSGAMVSDAVHSLSDVMTTVIAYVGVKISGKAADEGHPYGHERFECIASVILGIILAVTGFGIGYTGIQNITTGTYKELAIPTMLPLAAAVISVLGKEFMFQYTLRYARKINSAAFEADAWHHRSDALSSIGSFIGIAGAKMGYPIMDSVASVVICLFIFKVAYEVIKDAIDQMMDTACDQEIEKEMVDFVKQQPGVKHIDVLTTRQFGSKAYADVEISVDSKLTIVEAHKISEHVHHGLEANFPQVKHVMVHVNPDMDHEHDDAAEHCSYCEHE